MEKQALEEVVVRMREQLKEKDVELQSLKAQKVTYFRNERCQTCIYFLKVVDTIGNCKRLAFTVGVSQHNA